jgi:glutathione synthase/RimK-type ligase-like ATP-grasp enzyme
MYDVVILTDYRYENPKKINWYTQQVLTEDKILKESLKKKGLKVCKKNWNTKDFDWAKTKYAIFRSTWDYFDRFNEFFKWLDHTKEKTKFINSSDIILWNIDKHYLNDLEKQGINIAPTIFIEKGNKLKIGDLFKETKWEEAVIKPAISGAARHTYRLNKNNYNKYNDVLNELILEESFLFQEFLNNITTDGEISMMIIGGKYTHAVKKRAKHGDFRVQDDHGGTVETYNPSKQEILFAEKCIKLCPNKVVYARVDIIYDNNNKISLSELELIEPELWFRNNRKSADLLAEEIFNLI